MSDELQGTLRDVAVRQIRVEREARSGLAELNTELIRLRRELEVKAGREEGGRGVGAKRRRVGTQKQSNEKLDRSCVGSLLHSYIQRWTEVRGSWSEIEEFYNYGV